jgi:hypothetical protein
MGVIYEARSHGKFEREKENFRRNLITIAALAGQKVRERLQLHDNHSIQYFHTMSPSYIFAKLPVANDAANSFST